MNDAPGGPVGAAPVGTACRLCGAGLVGTYCHACGQPTPAAPRGLREVLLGQTGRLTHTLRMLFTRPGELAREIDEGRDRASLRPLTLLLNLIPLFFLLGGGPQGFSVRMFVDNDPSHQLAALIERAATRRDVPPAVFEERIEQRFRAVYSLLVVVQVIAYGLMIGLVERRRRKPWLVHFAAATHYMCFSFVLSIVLFGSMRAAGANLARHPAIGAIPMLINLTYLTLMLRRVYDDRVPVAIGKTVLVLLVDYAVAIVLTIVALMTALWSA